MYDTVSGYVECTSRLNVEPFTGRRLTTDERGTVARFWYTCTGASYEPRVNYYVNMSDPQDAGRLFIEFSIPKLAGAPLHDSVVTDAQLASALDSANAFIQRFASDLPDLREWTCVRVDYATNFHVDPDRMPEYLALLQSLDLSTYQRERYDGQGVVFKSPSRWVKFYDKGRQLGDGIPGTLRFEVSNMRSSVRYMCEHWFGCERTIGQLLNRERATYVLARIWERLSLGSVDTYRTTANEAFRLREIYGSSASSAHYALHMIRTYGVEAYKSGLMSQNNYYHWRRKLIDTGFYPSVDSHTQVRDAHVTLPSLGLTQNLGLEPSPNRKERKKIAGVKSDVTLPKILRGIYEAR